MRETPKAHRARTGQTPPSPGRPYAAAACTELGAVPRPLADDEPCPTLYRDVGPEALAAFLDGTLDRFAGPSNAWLYLQDASRNAHTRASAEFGYLTLLQPVALGPWLGRPGVYVTEADRAPERHTVGFVPPDEDLPSLDARLDTIGDAGALRAAIASYDDRRDAARGALARYLEERTFVERLAAPLRAALDRGDATVRATLLTRLSSEGLLEKDLRAPWFHLAPERRHEVRERLMALRVQSGGLLRTPPTPPVGSP